ncbi:hypothetical protein DAEQUDRAFT_187966 [Daedalea quercina L-15889]|uniref:Uncharacterized protein n=1 Tax=Daedalea quercina L-15889 TaxID=1314783 RepID=A0A165U2S1_9APHY|nr:hypothetical protein DAEQUDRAFT_187966 [Daedalea quercina L-15889]
MLSTSHPTPAHLALSDTERPTHPHAFVPGLDNAAVSQRVRFYHPSDVNVRGIHVLAFCSTIVSPGLQPIARQVRRLTVDFADVRPARAGLEILADALAAASGIEELTLLGMPAPDTDGWVLRKATFRLRQFTTNLALTSKDVLDFLRAQPDITALGARAPPPPDAPTKSAYQHMPFPTDLAPCLRTLDCTAPFLLSLQAAAPPTRQLANLRVDLNRLNPSVESEALRALATFSSTARRLSLRRSTLRQSPALDRSGALSMGSVVGRLAENRRWSRLRFLEMHDGTYDAVSPSRPARPF